MSSRLRLDSQLYSHLDSHIDSHIDSNFSIHTPACAQAQPADATCLAYHAVMAALQVVHSYSIIGVYSTGVYAFLSIGV